MARSSAQGLSGALLPYFVANVVRLGDDLFPGHLALTRLQVRALEVA